MRLERSFNIQPPEAISFRVSESARTQNNNLETAITPREIILFSGIGEEKDAETPDQAPEIDQADEPTVRVPVNGDWELFNTEPHPSQNFVNLYSGPFSQQMELNRKNAEKLLEVAAIEGEVILADRPMDRSRSIAGVNPDGSVTGRRKLFWGEKIEDEESSQSLVKSVPEGWRIEIPGQDIMDELSRRESKKPLDKRFADKFNQTVRQGLSKIIIREKLTPENPFMIRQVIYSFGSYLPLFLFEGIIVGMMSPQTIILNILGTSMAYPVFNLIKQIGLEENFPGRKLGHKMDLYEYFMPYVEVDRVLRGLAFASIKGRNLVRLRKEK